MRIVAEDLMANRNLRATPLIVCDERDNPIFISSTVDPQNEDCSDSVGRFRFVTKC